MDTGGGAGVTGLAVVALAVALVAGVRWLVALRERRRGDRRPLPGASGWARRQRGERHSAWYQTYMQSATWATRRQRTLRLAGYVCQQCGRAKATDAHHLTYVRLGFEEDKDLKAMCSACHAALHGQPAPRRQGVGGR